MPSPRCRVALVTAGDPARRTGGYLYNRHVLDALARGENAPGVEQIILPDGPPDAATATLRARLGTLRPTVAIVDSLVLPIAARLAETIQHEFGIRVVALMHMLPSDVATSGRMSGNPDGESLIGLERRLLSVADRAVAVSPPLKARLIRAGAVPDRVVVVSPGRDGCPIPPPARYRAPDRDHPPRFLAVANWSEQKGIHLIVEALARLDSVATLDLVGEPGDGAYARRVRDRIARYRLGGRVRVFGSLSADALAERYAASDAFVLPSLTEGFGIVYAEAMSFAKPVVAARVGPLPWLVQEGCGLLVPPDDVVALAAAMRTLATDGGLRQRLGENARRRAERLPTWQETEAA
ncbi:MAG: glycosyltransferase family 4 protein, partial [Chloroflexota bacterium]